MTICHGGFSTDVVRGLHVVEYFVENVTDASNFTVFQHLLELLQEREILLCRISTVFLLVSDVYNLMQG